MRPIRTPPYGGRMSETTAFTRTPTAGDRRQDLLLAAAVLIGGVISAGLSSIAQVFGEEQAPMWAALLVVFAVSTPLVVRRRWPAPVAILVALVYFISVTLRVPELYVLNITM